MDTPLVLKVPEKLVGSLPTWLSALGLEYRVIGSHGGNVKVTAYVKCEDLKTVKLLLEEQGIEVLPL